MKLQTLNKLQTDQFIIFQIRTCQRKYERGLRQELIGEVSLRVSCNGQIKSRGDQPISKRKAVHRLDDLPL